MGPDKTISINGAGIAGLTLALALAKFGFRVVIAEQHHEISQFGAGLQISPNARRVLNELGLDKALCAHSFEPEGIDIFRHGKPDPLSQVTLGQFAKDRYDGTPYAVMHRADLAQQLYKATKAFPNIEILFGATQTRVEDLGDAVSVIIERDGKPSYPLTARAHLGADGVRSVTRTDVLGGKPPQYTGYVAWRAMANIEQLSGILSTERTSLFWGPDYHMVVYPLQQRKQFNIVLVTEFSLPLEDSDTPEISNKSLRKNNRLSSIMESISDPWTAWPLFGVKTNTWYKGNVAILGDAAHAMLPFQAQGAAMSIEDAGLLAAILASETDNATAFGKWQNLRQPRANKVQDQSQKNAFVFHMSPPLSWGRDAVVSAKSAQGHLERLDWIYAHDPFEGLVGPQALTN
ncbi:FAD-dependent monooxygenase [Maritalea sp.]|jgi:salicylate hydroxylase|uniref:FAD-dependent monooxygenase n=1 Tax=Maritalea sp. TaxID=2003361 RepID=UPI0039E70B3D